MARPFVLGLTGSIGMGKSTVAAMIARCGVPVFDADATVRAMQGPKGALIGAIEAAFPGTTGPDGLNRTAMAAQVFGDDQALARLESIVHPAVKQAREKFLADHAQAELVVFDVPLLFEKGVRSEVDAVLVVSAPEAVQRARVLSREGMNPARFDAIVALQMPDAQKRALADYVIETTGTLHETEAQVAAMVEQLRAKIAAGG